MEDVRKACKGSVETPKEEEEKKKKETAREQIGCVTMGNRSLPKSSDL
jgi:hypothetical protein